ncbi:MAG: lipase maturation factor family protein, partial [Polyangiales bacterium]
MSTGSQQASAAPLGAGEPSAEAAAAARRSGPAVAGLFHRSLALVALFAWLSLASQVKVLVGRRGLEPASELFARLRASGVGFWDEPSLFWLGQSDGVLLGGTLAGAALTLFALAGVRPRLCFALSAPLYLSYATACSEFTAFQWDNMLVEVLALAACLPADRAAPLAHFAFRALLFKLYFESGIAKWQSHLHDWQDGSAMSYYYETAPLPAALAWYAHHLPLAWHRLESWGALALELLVPLLVFGPRAGRLLAFTAFSGFQVVNTATANYGFFTYLSMTLHLFLLSDGDIARASRACSRRLPWLGRWAEPPARSAAPALRPRSSFARRALALGALGTWLCASVAGALLSFDPAPSERGLGELYALVSPLRLANVYHLFGHITRERVEPQFETQSNGRWTEHDLRYKPGNVRRRPPYVAPHQPRVDFRLWFYGLSFGRGMPRYVDRLLDLLCRDPSAVQPLFA